jgi:hypothetical protein
MSDENASLVSVRYIVDDVQAAIDFYTRHLGFALRSAHLPAFADVTRGSLRLLLSGPQSSGARATPADACSMNRKLSPDDVKELCTLYEAGQSMVQLAEKFECHRHTVMRLLKKSGVEIRPQKLMTADLVAQATALYAKDHTLEEVGRLLGLEASTIGKALNRVGVQLRPPVADRWHRTPGG